MTRVSQLELYNDKDVITQICMMKQQVETGTYKDVDVQDDGAGNLVFTFTDQQDDTEVFTIPVKLISSVTSSQSGSTVTMRITWTDGTHDDYTWTAGGDVTTNTNQTITAIKTFNQSPIIPDSPSGTHAAVNVTYVSKTDGTNNLVHTSANEDVAGFKTMKTGTMINPVVSKIVNTADNVYVKLADISIGGAPRTIHGSLTSTYLNGFPIAIEFWVSSFQDIYNPKAWIRCIDNSTSDRIRITRNTSTNIWSIWFKIPGTQNNNDRALLQFFEEIYSAAYQNSRVSIVAPADQVEVDENDPSWSDYTDAQVVIV